MALLIFHFPRICMSEISGSFVWPSRQHVRLETVGRPTGSQSRCSELGDLRVFTVLWGRCLRPRGCYSVEVCVFEKQAPVCVYKQEG